MQNTEKSLHENISSDIDRGGNILSQGEVVAPLLPREVDEDSDPCSPVQRTLRHAGAGVWLKYVYRA